MTRSAYMFGLSWERKPRRGRIFSRPGWFLRNNFWLISKARLPRPLTSPVASLAIRKDSSMHLHPWTSCLRGLYLSPSDMAFHPCNIQGYNNKIQIAVSDAAIGHNPGINEVEPIASKDDKAKGDKAFQGKIASPAGSVHKGPQPLQNKTICCCIVVSRPR